MKFCIIASGSEGNCTLIEDSKGCAVLVDAGLSMRRISAGLEELGKDFSCICALLISHEHADHLRGAAVLTRRLDLPIYASAGTLALVKRFFPPMTRMVALNGQRLAFGDLCIEAFRVSHDASEALGFIITEGERRLAIATDLGHIDEATLEQLRGSDSIVLEANHDLEMLLKGPYPWDLKQRIRSSLGHLSNDQAAEALLQVAAPRLKRVILAHLSQENNHPDLALTRVSDALRKAGHNHIEVIVADQHKPTCLYEL